MPIKVRTLKGNTTIAWSNPDQTMAASWTITKEASEAEAWEILTKATVFIGRQLGQIPETTPGSSMNPPAPATSVTSTAGGSAPPSELSSAGKILMTPLKSDAPAGGAPVTGFGEKFWQDMPTNTVPGNLAPSWEMDVAEGWE